MIRNISRRRNSSMTSIIIIINKFFLSLMKNAKYKEFTHYKPVLIGMIMNQSLLVRLVHELCAFSCYQLLSVLRVRLIDGHEPKHDTECYMYNADIICKNKLNFLIIPLESLLLENSECHVLYILPFFALAFASSQSAQPSMACSTTFLCIIISNFFSSQTSS